MSPSSVGLGGSKSWRRYLGESRRPELGQRTKYRKKKGRNLYFCHGCGELGSRDPEGDAMLV